MRDHLEDGIRYERSGALDRALQAYEAALQSASSPSEIAEVLRHQADAYRRQAQWEPAVERARESASVAREAGLTAHVAEALNAEAAVHLSRGDFGSATALYEQVLALAPDDRIRGVGLQNLGSIAARQGNLQKAEACFLQSYECFQRAGYSRGEAIALNNYTAVALDSGDPSRAEAIGSKAIEAAQQVNDLELVGIARLNYAEALAKLAQFEAAEEHASAAFGFFQAAQNRWRQVRALLLIGEMSQHRDDPQTAARAYRKGLDIAREIAAHAEVNELEKRLAELGSG